MKYLMIYFSATGNTAKIAKVIEEKFKESRVQVDAIDITSIESRRKDIDAGSYNGLIIGAPVHTRRPPRIMREWLKTLNGKGKKCSMFFTYGGFGIHPCHYLTRQLLEEQNFIVVLSADFPAAHTFNLGGWKAMEGRPDSSDFDTAREFAEIALRRFTGEDPAIPGELEKTEHIEEHLDLLENSRFKVLTKLPSREGKECTMCMICEEACPSGAMDAESGRADATKCIACLACVAACPDRVLTINDMSKSWTVKLGKEGLSEKSLKMKKSKIYY